MTLDLTGMEGLFKNLEVVTGGNCGFAELTYLGQTISKGGEKQMQREFKAGDRVRVYVEDGDCECKCNLWIAKDMQKYNGQEAVIQDIPKENRYVLGVDFGFWLWCSHILEPISPANKPMRLDTCEVATRRTNPLAAKLLDKDVKALIKAGVLTDDLRVRDVEFVLSYLVEQNLPGLAAEARARLKEEKENK